MRKILILFSGGADSVLMFKMAELLWNANEVQIGPLIFEYGQKHKQEVEFAQQWLDNEAEEPGGPDFERFCLDISGCFKCSTSNLLEGKAANFPGVHSAHVPGRNTVFLATALSVAESAGYDEIWHGADYSDRVNLFPDCYQEYFVRMNAVAQICGSRPITIKAPLLGLTKEDVVSLLKAEGVDLSKVYSGYEPPMPR